MPCEYPTDSESDTDSIDDVATGVHMHAAAPVDIPPLVPHPEFDAGNEDVDGGGDMQAAEPAAGNPEGPRRGARVQPHFYIPGTALML